MISVIVPVYNVQNYVKKCVRSIMTQTYTNLEIILVDDGSLDNSGLICDELAKEDTRIKVIHQVNQGLSGARNAGLKIAKGEYITFVDSDDYISNTLYENMICMIEKTNSDICMCSSVILDENNMVIGREMYEDGRIYSTNEIFTEIVLPLKTSVWNKLYRRELIENKYFPVGYIHGEDLVFHMRVLTENLKLVTISECGYYYIKHRNSITTSNFSSKSFDEVYCKDLSWKLLNEKYPEYTTNALVWRFRARMNLIRKTYSDDNKQFETKINEYKTWTKINYKLIKNLISTKEKIEFGLMMISPRIHKYIINRMFR